MNLGDELARCPKLPKATTTESPERAEARRLRALGMSYDEIARRLGRGQTTVWNWFQ
jgi:transposase